MTDLTTIIVVAVVVIVVLALAVTAAAVLRRRRRSTGLREQFGPEYDRAVSGADDPRDAEKELEQRRKRHRSLKLRDLQPREREGYRQRWTQVQQSFVDDPGTAVRDADRLVGDVMSARGYPIEDFDQQAQDLSVAYPVVTQRYREARTISREHAAGRAGTEDLRHAVTSYRALIEALLEPGDGRHGHGSDDSGSGDGRSGRRDSRDNGSRDGSIYGSRDGRGPDRAEPPAQTAPPQQDEGRRETRA